MLFGGTLSARPNPAKRERRMQSQKKEKKKEKKNFLVQVLSLRSIRRKHKFIQRRDLGEF